MILSMTLCEIMTELNETSVCSNCDFFCDKLVEVSVEATREKQNLVLVVSNDLEVGGYCKRFPPTRWDDKKQMSRFPRVSGTEWCGEHLKTRSDEDIVDSFAGSAIFEPPNRIWDCETQSGEPGIFYIDECEDDVECDPNDETWLKVDSVRRESQDSSDTPPATTL